MTTRRRIEYMCPHCGWRFDALLGGGLVPIHKWENSPGKCVRCPGSEQAPRNPESDRRPLWKDLPAERGPTDHERKGTAEASPGLASVPTTARLLLDAVWPDESTEACMLEDAALMESEYEPTSTGHDTACHVKALLCRVRDLERALRATGYFQQRSGLPEGQDPGAHDYFAAWKEAVEYQEGVDALLDNVVPTRQDGKTLWLRDRVEMLRDKALELQAKALEAAKGNQR